MCRSIDQCAKTYNKVSIWITAGLTLAVLLAAQILSTTSTPILSLVVMPLIVSVVFSLISGTVYVSAWKKVAKTSPLSLSRFYITASMLRMMAALLVALVGALVLKGNTRQVLGFTAVFVGFYIVMLIFDCVFFSRTEKKLNLK